MATRARTMTLQPGDPAGSWNTGPNGSVRIIVTAIVGDVALGFTAFTPAPKGSVSDTDEYILQAGETLDLVFRADGDGAFRVASANTVAAGPSVVSILSYPL